MRRLMVLLAVLVALVSPTAAYADDGVNFAESFASGVGTWGGGQEEKEESNSSVEVRENGGLLAAPATGESSTVDYVSSTVNSFNTVPWSNSNRTLLESVQVILGNQYAEWRNMIILPAIALCFLWWGGRKALRTLMAAWRRGKASV